LEEFQGRLGLGFHPKKIRKTMAWDKPRGENEAFYLVFFMREKD